MKTTTYTNRTINFKFEFDNGDTSWDLKLCGMSVSVYMGALNTVISIRKGDIITQFTMDSRPCRWDENAEVFARSVVWAYVKQKANKKSKSSMADKVIVFDHTTLVTEIVTSNVKTKAQKVNYVKES